MDALPNKLFSETPLSSKQPLKLLLFRIKLLFSVFTAKKLIVLVNQNKLRIFRPNVATQAFDKDSIIQSRIQTSDGNLLL